MSFTKEEIKYFASQKITMINAFIAQREKEMNKPFRPQKLGILESAKGNYVWYSFEPRELPTCDVCGKELLEGTLVDPSPETAMNYPRWFCLSLDCSKARSSWVYGQLLDYREHNGDGDSYFNQALHRMNIPPAFHNKTLSKLSGMEKVVGSLRREIKDQGSIFLSGSPGLGKTHLAVGLLIESGVKAPNRHRFVNVTRLLGEIVSAIRTGEDYSKIINDLGDYHMIVLDDVGAEKTTEHVRSVIYQIVNDRILNNKITIVTSNLSLTQIGKQFDQRLSSRLSEFKGVNLAGEDYRIKKAG